MIKPMITDDTANVSRSGTRREASAPAGATTLPITNARPHPRRTGGQFQWECWARYAIE